MIDLHTHTIHSDGELVPSELVQRALNKGYRAIALTDHVDRSNIHTVIPAMLKVAADLNKRGSIKVIPGVELTHVPPEFIGDMVREARTLGARIVLVHGESIVEPVAQGTNRAAIEAGADVLAHPGLISIDDVLLARDKGVTLEITARRGHSLSNGYVAKLALTYGVPVTINTDSHSPGDLITKEMAMKVLLSCGIPNDRLDAIFRHSEFLVDKAMK